jgi:hypothetical protein
LCHPPEWDHITGRRALAERGPIVHEVPALLEKVATTVGGLDALLMVWARAYSTTWFG